MKKGNLNLISINGCCGKSEESILSLIKNDHKFMIYNDDDKIIITHKVFDTNEKILNSNILFSYFDTDNFHTDDSAEKIIRNNYKELEFILHDDAINNIPDYMLHDGTIPNHGLIGLKKPLFSKNESNNYGVKFIPKNIRHDTKYNNLYLLSNKILVLNNSKIAIMTFIINKNNVKSDSDEIITNIVLIDTDYFFNTARMTIGNGDLLIEARYDLINKITYLCNDTNSDITDIISRILEKLDYYWSAENLRNIYRIKCANVFRDTYASTYNINYNVIREAFNVDDNSIYYDKNKDRLCYNNYELSIYKIIDILLLGINDLNYSTKDIMNNVMNVLSTCLYDMNIGRF